MAIGSLRLDCVSEHPPRSASLCLQTSSKIKRAILSLQRVSKLSASLRRGDANDAKGLAVDFAVWQGLGIGLYRMA